MKNAYMKDYWRGYRAAKNTAHYCGIEAAKKDHAYGLQGKSSAFCSGYARYIRDNANKRETVKDSHGVTIDYNASVQLMDDSIRETLHSEMAPCTDQEFFDAYAQEHAKKFGVSFAPYASGNW